MALSSTTSRVSYSGNGVTTAFSFPYYFLAAGDLVVIERDNTTGAETTKTLTTHYTVSGAGESAGGTVTMLSAPASGKTLVIYRDPAVTQGVDLVENDALPAETLEQALDRLTMIAQRLKDLQSRSVRLSDGFSPTFTPTLPVDLDDAGGKVPLINDAGTGFADAADWPTADDIEDAEENATAAAASATAAASSASSASSSATAAAASAAAAAAAVASTFYRDVVYKTSADSPVTISSSDNGKLFVFDTSGGAISVTLPQISGLTPPFNVACLLKTAGNTLTVNRAGTDTIIGATSKAVSAAGVGFQLAADTDANPDDWSAMDFGAAADGSITEAKIASGAVSAIKAAASLLSNLPINVGLAASVAGNALTIALKTAAGTDPSATDVVKIPFRNSTLTNGSITVVSVTGALSTVISAGSTGGHVAGESHPIHVYALNNGGTAELAWSTSFFEDGTVQSTTAEGGAGAADNPGVLYSTTARSNVPIKYLGTFISNQATAGTYAVVPTRTSVGPMAPQVVHNTAAMQRIVSAHIGNGGTPSVTAQDGSWISSLTDNGAGDVTINIVAGIFSAAPRPVISAYTGGTGRETNIKSDSAVSTSLIWTVSSNGAAGEDHSFFIMAFGQK